MMCRVGWTLVLMLQAGIAHAVEPDPESKADAAKTSEAAPAPTAAEEEAAALRRRLEQTEAMLQLLLQQQLQGKAAAPAPLPVPVFDEKAWRALPNTVPYRKGSVAPEHYELSSTIRRGAVITGGTMLGVGWLGSTIAAAGDQEVDGVVTLGPLYAPVVGPWIAIGLDARYGDLSPLGAWALVFDGLVQDVGFAIMVWGLVDKKPIYTKKNFELSSVMVVPGSNGARLALSGQF